MKPKCSGKPIELSLWRPTIVRAYGVKADYLSLSRRFNEALGAADAGLAVNPNDVLLLEPRTTAENSLGRFEQARPMQSGRCA